MVCEVYCKIVANVALVAPGSGVFGLFQGLRLELGQQSALEEHQCMGESP